LAVTRTVAPVSARMAGQRPVPSVALSRATLGNIRQNVAIALGLKAVFLVTTIAGITGLWPAILAVQHRGVRRFQGRVRAAAHRDADAGGGQGRRVIDAVADHRDRALLLQGRDLGELVLRQELGLHVVIIRGTEALGAIAVRDEPRADAAAGIAALRKLGVRSVMLT
jgi:hypothetical protein